MTVYLSAITPSCATVTSMAQLYNRDAAHSSALYVLSTLLSIMTMPLMIGLFDMLVWYTFYKYRLRKRKAPTFHGERFFILWSITGYPEWLSNCHWKNLRWREHFYTGRCISYIALRFNRNRKWFVKKRIIAHSFVFFHTYPSDELIINTSFYNLSHLLFPHRIFAFAKVFGFVLDFTFSYILSASGSQHFCKILLHFRL